MYIFCSIILIIAALFMVVTVLMQDSKGNGLGALAGQTDTYLGKNKAKTLEAKLALGTKVAAAVFVVVSLVMLIIPHA